MKPIRIFYITFFVFFLTASKSALAQPLLPDVVNVTENGINVLTWECQYDGIKSIAVERSEDSIFNFKTVGYVLNVKKGIQYFLDGHALPGNNFYRLKIIFGSDLVWTSNRVKVKLDSSEVAGSLALPSNDSLQRMISKLRTKTISVSDSVGDVSKKGNDSSKVPHTVSGNVGVNPNEVKPAPVDKPVIKIEIPDIDKVNAYTYVKSQYVFTNPFTGHVNIELDKKEDSKFSIEFFNSKDVKIIDIPYINESTIIVDKRNFQKSGVYKFELYKNKVKFETGYISIY